jgi:hypothetical protein
MGKLNYAFGVEAIAPPETNRRADIAFNFCAAHEDSSLICGIQKWNRAIAITAIALPFNVMGSA